MAKLFLVSGMGADERLFKNLDLSGFEVVPARWIDPHPQDTLEVYAQKLIGYYGIESGSSVIGVSLGGMIAVEIAKQVAMRHAIIVSSIKSPAEAPAYYKFFKTFPIYTLLSGEFLIAASSLVKPIMGKMAGIHADLFYSMLKKTSPVFLKWSIGAALNWDNDVRPESITHLIGDNDKVFSYKKISDAIVVPGGDHMMVFNYARRLNPIIKNILGK